ncbi:phage portal protein [Kribbella hippodromi]|uniref:phage portal protein n=1 Tax=Kribbella hippodromi TaxID=434347 RepID=UPI0031DE2BA4
MIIDGTPVNMPMSLYRGGMSLPGAWRAALMISDLVGSVPWDAYVEREGRAAEKITPRPWLLEQPAPPEVRMTTFSSWALDLIWHGNAIGLVADRDIDGYPTAVLPIPAEEVGVRRVGYEAMSALPVGAIEYQIGGQGYGVYDVVHVKGPCKPSDVRGFGVLEAHLSGLTGADGGTLDLAIELQRQARSVGAHGVPTGTLKSDNPDLTKDEADRMKATWLAAQRDRTVAVLNATTSFESLAWNPTELQLVEARKMSLLETALLFGVQPSALGVETSNRTYRNDNAEDVKFAKWGLRGHVGRFEQCLSQAFPPGVCVEANLDDVLRADALTRAQVAQIRVNSKVWTRNEARAEDGRPPLEGGDAIDPAEADPSEENANEPQVDPAGQ